MLEVLTGHEIVFYPVSSSDQKLKGQIQLRNANNSRYLVYKIKSTDINAFQADPSKGILDPFETKSIPVLTTRSVDPDYAKILAQKNKFLIEYVLLNTRPNSIEEAASSLKSANTQSVKIYINTDSVRGYSSINSNREPSAIGTNKISYHSVAHGRSLPNLPSSSNIVTPVGDQIQSLKQEISRLEIQRARLKDSDGTRRDNKGGFLKYMVLMTIGVIAGNLGSKHLGINQFINEKLTPSPVITQQAHQEEGFFSIFNFGNDEEKTHLKDSEQKSWWDIL